jgi:hypothetical protein
MRRRDWEKRQYEKQEGQKNWNKGSKIKEKEKKDTGKGQLLSSIPPSISLANEPPGTTKANWELQGKLRKMYNTLAWVKELF